MGMIRVIVSFRFLEDVVFEEAMGSADKIGNDKDMGSKEEFRERVLLLLLLVSLRLFVVSADIIIRSRRMGIEDVPTDAAGLGLRRWGVVTLVVGPLVLPQLSFLRGGERVDSFIIVIYIRVGKSQEMKDDQRE
jgi:hypothetical protein